MIREDLILAEIARLTRENGFELSSHAYEQMDLRHMNLVRVEQILLNPERLIRVDLTARSPHYKIQGGPARRKLAVAVENGIVVVLTVM